MWFFDLVNLDSPDQALLAAAHATFDRAYRNGIGPTTSVGVLSKMAIAGTTLGRVDATRFLVPNQIRALTAERPTAYRGGQVLANRMTLREGPQALDAQRLGRAAEALQLALLQSFRRRRPAIRSSGCSPHGRRVGRGLHPPGARRFRRQIVDPRRTDRVRRAALDGAGAPARLRNPWGMAP